MKRLLSAVLLVCLIGSLCFSALADDETEVVYPEHRFHYENGTVVEDGIRAMQDFEVAQSINPDLIGWIYSGLMEGGFPVMAGTKDNYYSTRTYRGTQKKGRSCVYLPYEASTNFVESTPILYASTKEINAYGCFRDLVKQSEYEANPYFRLLTPGGDYQLDIFAVYKSREFDQAELTPPTDEAEFQVWLAGITESSAIDALPECLPAYGEKVIILAANSGKQRRIVLAVMRPIRYDTRDSYWLNKWELDSAESTSHTVDLGVLGEKMLYCQKDPLWSQMRFESAMTTKYRIMSGGACGPLALANILINILTPEELTSLDKDCPTGFGALFCTCSVNLLYCNHSHIPYRLSSAEEYARYLPVLLCNFASGNNPYGVQSRWPNGSGTNTIYVPYVCEALGLSCTPVHTLTEGIELVRNSNGRGGLLCCALDASPFSQPGSTHFVAVIGVDEENYVYVLDSMESKKYKGHVVETVCPGVGRFLATDSSGASLSPYYYIEKPEETHENAD